MKRKLFAMSLSLVIASSLVLGGCGKEEKEVATSTETEVESVFEDVEDTEKDTEKVVAEATEEKETEKETESKDSKGSTSNTINGSTGNVVNGSTGSSSGNKSGSTSGNSGSVSGGNLGNSSSSNNSGSTSHNGNTSGGTSSSNTETPHVHNWVAVTTTVHHPAETHQEDQGHYETVVDSEAWDEEVPKYTERGCYCLTCYYRKGEIVKLANQAEVDQHCLYHATTLGQSCQYGIQSLQNGTEIIHHDAVTHQEWVPNVVTVVDKEAWDEEVITGYVCSECGATK